MSLFERKALPATLAPLSSYAAGWWPLVRESFTGAWQRNVTIDRSTVAAYWAVFSCVTLIAGDIAKLPANVMRRLNDIFEKTLLRPVLRKPNRFQTRIEFFFDWVRSLLLHGNTYVLKQRDENKFVVALYVLDPLRVTPLVSEDGGIYYELNTDNIAGLTKSVTVPASEIIHDRMYTLYHPLIGVSPIFACGAGAMQGAAIQANSNQFFTNMSLPSGILTAPGAISESTAQRLKDAFSTNYSGTNAGKIAVVSDGLKFERMTINAVDSQLIEQLKMTAEMTCACFHVPGYKIGVGPMPTVNNTAALNQQYYDQCLQYIIEKMELRLEEGLEVETPYEVWFDVNALLRMDPEARFKSHNEAIAGGWLAPNEARAEEDLKPVEGGGTPYMQQQNWPLNQLASRPPPQAPTALAPPTALPGNDASNDPPVKQLTRDDVKQHATQELSNLLAVSNG